MAKKIKIVSQTTELFMRAFLLPVEKTLLQSVSLEDGTFSRPVFVVGPPRSGTTLLYQVLVSRFNFVYLNNLSSRLYLTPLLGTGLSKILGMFSALQKTGYSSTYGKTDSIGGPNEAGEFWYRWFPRGEHVYVAPNETSAKSIQELRRQVIGISKKFKAPMLFKNTYNSMRIAPIMEAFPEAVFLVCKRDPLDTAQSILEGRMKANRNKNDWWSAPPKEIDEIIHHPYWEQVTEQVYYIYKQIDDDSQSYGKDRFLNVPYRGLCEDTRGAMGNIQQFLGKCGVQVSVRGNVPENFPYSTGKKIEDEDYARLQQRVSELWKA